MPRSRGEHVSTSDLDIEEIVHKALNAAMEVFKTEFGQRLSVLEEQIQSVSSLVNDKVITKIADIESALDKLGTHVFSSDANTAQAPIPQNVATTDDLDAVKKQAFDVALQLNQNEQYNRRLNVRIKGLACTQRDDCCMVVRTFLRERLRCDVPHDEIEAAHIIPQKPDPNDQSGATSRSSAILVRFKSRSQRDTVMRSRKLLKGTKIIIQEDLTTLNLQTLNRVRKNDQVSHTWSWNGRIYTQLKDGTKLLVKPFQPLNECAHVMR